MSDRTNINQVVGIQAYGEIYVLDSLFKHRDDFMGATGTIIYPVSKEQYEYATSTEALEERFEDIWQISVQEAGETRGLSEFVQDIYMWDGDESVFDMGGISWDVEDHIREVMGYSEEEYPVLECVGAGRIFSSTDIDDMVKTYNTELWLDIYRYERGLA